MTLELTCPFCGKRGRVDDGVDATTRRRQACSVCRRNGLRWIETPITTAQVTRAMYP